MFSEFLDIFTGQYTKNIKKNVYFDTIQQFPRAMETLKKVISLYETQRDELQHIPALVFDIRE